MINPVLFLGYKMKYIFTTLFLLGSIVSLYADSGVEKVIVMDLSGSMYGKIGNTLKITEAQHVARKILDSLDGQTQVGLVVMGGKRRKGCSNYRVAVSPKRGASSAVLNHILNTKPRGKTPLARALKKAVQSLKSPNQATVVLISDGKERCGNNACKVVKEYTEQYPGLRMDIVSLATEADAKQKLKCMAESKHVSYHEIEASVQISQEEPCNIPLQKKHLDTETPKIKFYAALPPEDETGVAIHQVYAKEGTLVVRCESTQKVECIQSILPGKYMVHTSYQGENHQTKLLVLQGMDAFLFTSFKKNNVKSTPVYANNTPVIEVPEPEVFEEESQEIFSEEMMRGRMEMNGRKKRRGGYLF